VHTPGSTYNQEEKTEGASLGSSSQVSTPHGGSISSQFKIVGHDPTTRLLEFRGVEFEDPEKNLFICEKT
jgi:hypothetical protein